jgi:voltage-gated sodium channel
MNGAAAAHAAGGRGGSKSQAPPATAYSTACDSQPESFEEWQAMLMASSSAKTEPSAPILGAIPPKSMRIFEGPMEKKALSSLGVKWHGRYATLTDFHLGFAKRLDMNSTKAMHWMHTKKLPTSVSLLEETFKKFDGDGNGTLDLEEAKACLIELHLYSNDQDVQILFEALDVDTSGTLTLEEFMDLTTKAHAANHVVEYIPLVEILDVKAEIHAKKGGVLQSGKGERSLSLVEGSMSSDTDAVETNRNPSFLKVFLNRLEAATGLDIDGDGKADTAVRMPGHDPSVSEVHIVITTIEGGHNTGKTYFHRVPESDAQGWLEALTSAVNHAKAEALKKELELKYGHSKYSMIRAKSQVLYASEGFQMVTALFILCAFALDICESQFLPVQGSRSSFIFLIFDAILTILFTLELMLNIFAHSNNGFQPFYSKGTNWFDAAIVIISVCNVVVTASGGELPNAKLLRLLRLGRAVKLFKTLKELNRLITSVSKAVVPVCNAFLILFIIAAIYAILGTNFFGEQSPEFFLNFKTSLFTMFQVLSGDGWSDLARSLFARDETDTTGIRKTDSSVAFFFVSYMLINSIMLLNVVVAVLLVPLCTYIYIYI